jgi:hypothetical protein
MDAEKKTRQVDRERKCDDSQVPRGAMFGDNYSSPIETIRIPGGFEPVFGVSMPRLIGHFSLIFL